MRLVPSASAARGKIKQAQAARESKTLKSGFIFDLVFWVPISQGRIGPMRALYEKPRVSLSEVSKLLFWSWVSRGENGGGEKQPVKNSMPRGAACSIHLRNE